MRTQRLKWAAMLILAAGCVCAPAPGRAPPTDAPQRSQATRVRSTVDQRRLVGTWRVVRFCDVDSLGHESEPFGPNPVGYFIYTPSGQLSIQVMRTPAIPPFARDTAPSSAELRALFDGYFGYFGTYTVTSDTSVVHHVVGGTIPEYVGRDEPRPYWIWGAHQDSLSIGSMRARGCRLLVRIA